MDSILPPGVFEGALHAFLIGEFFIESIRTTIRAGVCNCSRVIQVGAIYGALSGVETILQDLDTENSCLESVKPSLELSVSQYKVRMLQKFGSFPYLV